MKRLLMGLAIAAAMVMALNVGVGATSGLRVPGEISCDFDDGGPGMYTYHCTLSNFFETPGDDISWSDVERTIQSLLRDRCQALDGGARPEAIQLSMDVQTLSWPILNPDIAILGSYMCGYWGILL